MNEKDKRIKATLKAWSKATRRNITIRKMSNVNVMWNTYQKEKSHLIYKKRPASKRNNCKYDA